MTKRAGFAIVLAIVLTLAMAIGLVACGDSDKDERTRERCEVCDPADIDRKCVSQCREFCAAGEDCTARCNRECDVCKAELECRACATACAGTVSRCAPVDEPITCEDGQF